MTKVFTKQATNPIAGLGMSYSRGDPATVKGKFDLVTRIFEFLHGFQSIDDTRQIGMVFGF